MTLAPYQIPSKGSLDDSDMTPREKLVYLRDFLRHGVPEELWDFNQARVDVRCGTAGCAYGWYGWLTGRQYCTGEAHAHYSREWNRQHDQPPKLVRSAEAEFGLNLSEARALFDTDLARRLGKTMEEITPADVANEIDKYLEGRL